MAENPLAALAERINKTSTAHGFWPDDKQQALDALVRVADLLEGQRRNLGPIKAYIEAQSVRNLGEMLMLATSELAEALEEHRDGKPIAEWRCKACGRGTGSIDVQVLPKSCTCNGVGHHWTPDDDTCIGPLKPEGVLVELLDCIIRCLDTALGVVREAGEDPSLIDHVGQVKMDFNDSRPYKHGRGY